MKMPNYILQIILKQKPINAEDMLAWIGYVPYANEHNYIMRVANALQN